MSTEHQNWHNCIHGLLLNEAHGREAYICANESVVKDNHREKGVFGDILYVKLTSVDKANMCIKCPVYDKRFDIRTHRKALK